MKRLLFIVAALCLVSSVFAAAPVYLSSADLNLSTNFTDVMMKEIDDEHYAVLSQPVTGGQCVLRVVNSETGIVTDTSPLFTCGGIDDIDVDLGTIAVCYRTGPRQGIRIYKWPDEGFLAYKTSLQSGLTNPVWGGCKIDSSSSTTADLLVTNFRPTSSYFAGNIKIYFNGTSPIYTSYPIVVPFSYKNPYDDDNEVYAFQNNLDANFYNNTDIYNTSGKILSTLALGEDISVWNHNSNAPIWMTENGYMEIITDYTSPLETSGSISMDYILAVAAQSEVYGLIGSTWYIADFTSPGSPSTTSLGMTIDNYVTYPLFYDADIFRTYTSEEKIYIANAAGVINVYQYAGAGGGVGTAPEYTIQFLGTDEDEEDFIFLVSFTDVEGGRVYDALDINKYPEDFFDESYNVQYNFNTEDDLSFLSTLSGCGVPIEISYGDYHNLGAAWLNESCVAPVFFTLPQAIKADTLTFDGTVDVTASFSILLSGDPVDSSLSFVDNEERYLFYLIFDVYNGGSLINISYVDSNYTNVVIVTDYPVSNLSSLKDYYVYTTVDFVNDEMTFRIVNSIGNVMSGDMTVPFIQEGIEDIATVAFGEAREDGDLYVTYLSFNYDADVEYPEYYFFANLDANTELFDAVHFPIPGLGEFGSYKATLFGTDDGLGFSYYENPEIISFDYAETTKQYTSAEVADIVAEHNRGVEPTMIEGDWLTSLNNAFELYGIKSSGSKFLLGMFLWMIISLPAAAAAGPEVGVIAGVLGFVVLSYLGLFPAWFIIVMVIVSGFVMFMGFRKMVQG